MAAPRLLLLGSAALALGGCQPRSAGPDMPTDPGREADAIQSAAKDRAEQMSDHDLDRAAAYFSPTAVVAWPGGRAVRGSAQIRAALAESFKDPAFHVEVELPADHITVSKEGDVASAAGDYALTRTDPATNKPVTVHGPFLETFAKDADGEWRVVAGVSGAAAPAAPE